jgi:hypothetical protein
VPAQINILVIIAIYCHSETHKIVIEVETDDMNTSVFIIVNRLSSGDDQNIVGSSEQFTFIFS